jgi:hypothetical protein
MKEILNIFCVVECGGLVGGFRSFLLISWFSRINAFPYAEFSEIWETDLEFSNSLSSGDEVLGLASYSLLLDLCHFGGMVLYFEDCSSGGVLLAIKKMIWRVAVATFFEC